MISVIEYSHGFCEIRPHYLDECECNKIIGLVHIVISIHFSFGVWVIFRRKKGNVHFELDNTCSFLSVCHKTKIVIKKSLKRNLLKFKSAFNCNCNHKQIPHQKRSKYLTIESILIANSFELNASHLALSKLRAKIVFLIIVDVVFNCA